MRELFASLYETFVWFFDTYLGMYLYGYDCNTGGFTNNSLYIPLGLIMVLGSILMVSVFYYIINHPRFNKWWAWLIVLGVNAIAQFSVAYFWIADHYHTGKICNDLVVSLSNIFDFGLVNLFWSVIVFIVFSFILRWWSRNSSCTPYPL